MSLSRKNRGVAAVLATALIGAFAALVTATPAAAATSPVADRPAGGVTADALPTVQVDGVVWSQAVVGNTVYAGGQFANARPAGAAAGTNQTPRGNLLAYNITTGNLVTSFAPSLNAQVKAVAASPDGSRVYVGGYFTSADGQARYRLAAYDTSTGALISSFAPSLDAAVNAITVTNTTVYVGGVFGVANGVARNHLAAFSASTGALLGWAPSADDVVDALQLTPDGTHVVVGGSFQNINGAQALGLGSVDATTGALVPFAVNQVVKDYGSAGRDPVAAHRRHGDLRHRLRLRRPQQLRGRVLGRPDHRRHQLAGRLPRRHLRHLPGRLAGLRRQPRALLQQHRRLPGLQPAHDLVPLDGVHQERHRHGADQRRVGCRATATSPASPARRW